MPHLAAFATELETLAARLARMPLAHRRAELPHELRSDLTRDLRALAGRIRAGAPPAEAPAPKAPVRTGSIVVGRRLIQVVTR